MTKYDKNRIFSLKMIKLSYMLGVFIENGKKILKKKVASAGNRTRAARVAGEHSTTEPLMLGKDDILAASHGYPKKEART